MIPNGGAKQVAVCPKKNHKSTKVSQSLQNLSYLNVTQFKINYPACEILRFFIVPPKEEVETLLICPWKWAKANKKPSQGQPILQHQHPSCRDVLWEGFGTLSQHCTAGSSGFSMDGSYMLWSIIYLLQPSPAGLQATWETNGILAALCHLMDLRDS